MDKRRLDHIQTTLSWTNDSVPFHRHIQRSALQRTARVDAYIANRGCHRGKLMYSKSVICGSSTAEYEPHDATKLTETESVAFTTEKLMGLIAKNHRKVREATGIHIFNSDYIDSESMNFTFPPDVLRILCE